MKSVPFDVLAPRRIGILKAELAKIVGAATRPRSVSDALRRTIDEDESIVFDGMQRRLRSRPYAWRRRSSVAVVVRPCRPHDARDE